MANFRSATFASDANFRSTTFSGDANFRSTTFTSLTSFNAAAFAASAHFIAATFESGAEFISASFTGDAYFGSSTFASGVLFNSASFAKGAIFSMATFASIITFDSIQCAGDADFRAVTFTDGVHFNSAVFAGRADFSMSTCTGMALFRSTAFGGGADFRAITFTSSADFRSTSFTGDTIFWSTTFSGFANFNSATFSGFATFSSATFAAMVDFSSTAFTGRAEFRSAAFSAHADFNSATFSSDLLFQEAVFDGLQHVGPLMCAGEVNFDRARLTGTQVTIEASARAASFERAAFEGSAVLRLRYATVDLSRVALSTPMALQTWPVAFATRSGSAIGEHLLASGSLTPEVKLASLEGMDAAQLVLTDIDLTLCQFTGAFHLDQIQIGFGCRFARPPESWQWRGLFPARWSPRKVLAEEQYWRAAAGGRAGRGWPAGPHHEVPERGAGPDDLVGAYQQLRKAFEEARNEPDAADFYYGEMEMRRRDAQRPRAERWLLWLYWLASGYGLRASRALSLLMVAMGVTLALTVLFGLPDDSPNPRTSGTYGGGVVQTTTKTPDPVLSLPWGKRVTAERTKKAALVVVNSVVFRSSGQNLTLPGTVIEMASRIGEPVLLGLAALAIRSRVKR